MPRHRSRRSRGRRGGGKSPFGTVSLPATLLGAAVLCYFAVQLTTNPMASSSRPRTTTRPAFQPPKIHHPVVPFHQIDVTEPKPVEPPPPPPPPQLQAATQVVKATETETQQTQSSTQQQAPVSTESDPIKAPSAVVPPQEAHLPALSPVAPASTATVQSPPNTPIGVGPPPLLQGTQSSQPNAPTTTVAATLTSENSIAVTKSTSASVNSSSNEQATSENKSSSTNISNTTTNSTENTPSTDIAAAANTALSNVVNTTGNAGTQDNSVLSGELAQSSSTSSDENESETQENLSGGGDEAKTEETSAEDDVSNEVKTEDGSSTNSEDEKTESTTTTNTDETTSNQGTGATAEERTVSAEDTSAGAPPESSSTTGIEESSNTRESTKSTTNDVSDEEANKPEEEGVGAVPANEASTSTMVEDEDDSSGLSRIGHNMSHASVQVRHGKHVLRIPRGSRVTGNLPEFLGVVPARGGMVRGQNVTRVSYALFKIIQLFQFRNMIDFPCGAHIEWMSEMLQRVEFDRPMFSYMGIDTNCSALPIARERIGEIGQGAEFQCMDIISERIPGPSDVLFYWPDIVEGVHDARSDSYPSYVEEVMKNAKSHNITYIIIPQWPRVRGRAVKYRYGRWVFEGEDDGLRPFLMNEQVRGVVPTVQNSDDPYIMYMTFYALPAITFYD